MNFALPRLGDLVSIPVLGGDIHGLGLVLDVPKRFVPYPNVATDGLIPVYVANRILAVCVDPTASVFGKRFWLWTDDVDLIYSGADFYEEQEEIKNKNPKKQNKRVGHGLDSRDKKRRSSRRQKC